MIKLNLAMVTGAALLSALGMATDRDARADGEPRLTPVIVFPAFHFTRLGVTVHGQTVAPECPANGAFEDWYQNPHPGVAFSQVCRDKLLTMTYTPDEQRPMRERFSDPPGVTVTLLDYGTTASAPFYEPLYASLEAAGYTRDVDLRVAGYDARTTPDMDGFLERTVALIEETYHQNHRTPVHLVGHSNGPLYAQYLLTHSSRSWRHKFIHGFSPLAGNWPGQGLFYPSCFTGLNIIDFGFPTDPANAESSAAMYLSHPSSYMSASDPAVFGAQEIVVKVGNKPYTPASSPELWQDAELPVPGEIASHYLGFVKFRQPAFFPDVDVYAEKGSGLSTVVGLGLANLRVGQVVSPATPLFTRSGDTNQEDLTNDSIEVWKNMPCFHFELRDNPGVDHFSLPGDAGVLRRLLHDLRRKRSVCPEHD